MIKSFASDDWTQSPVPLLSWEVRGLGKKLKRVGCDVLRRSARSGVMIENARLRQRRSGGREELPYAWGQGRWSRRATTSPRSGAEAQRNYPTPEFRGPTRVELPHLQGAAAGGPRGDTPCSRSGGAAEKMPFVQHKEQWLRFAGATVKRYPTSKVRETQVRQWVLREGIRGQTH